jgi:hypothetical protein
VQSQEKPTEVGSQRSSGESPRPDVGASPPAESAPVLRRRGFTTIEVRETIAEGSETTRVIALSPAPAR